MYSFSKEGRNQPKRPIYCQSFYDLKSSFAGQNYENIASFGIGEKSPLKKMNCETPEPGSYLLKSEFDKNVEKELGFSFGIGHRHYKKVYNESIGP